MKAVAAKKVSKGIDLSGLENFNVSSLMKAGSPVTESDGKPLEIPLAKIVEDPNQPRTGDNPGFSSQSLAELAESIVESGGVKTPISVRPKNADGVYVINHGARRFRASKLAKFKTIRAFIDAEHDEYDQAIENIQRENFTPMEVALFIARREKGGDSRAAIAKRIGKSKAFVTQHASLLTLTPELRQIYDDNRCRDVLALYELANLNKRFPLEVAGFISESEISRSTVEALKASMKAETSKAVDDGAGEGDTAKRSFSTKTTPTAVKCAVMVKHAGTLYVLRADKPPSALHLGWIENPETRTDREIELSELTLDSIVPV